MHDRHYTGTNRVLHPCTVLGLQKIENVMHARQIRNVANTGCVPWGGKLLATFEAGQVRPGAAVPEV